ncbi:hypothetical protein PS663_03430 [Pseudomonas fluorescens]|nr:hypothetical protein PS663_03430 [Pseudomonas fluorescens]
MKRIYSFFCMLLAMASLIWLVLRFPVDSPALQPFPIILPPPAMARPVDELVIFYSGDGGWSGGDGWGSLEQNVSRQLNERGYGVLGISTLAYFWREQPVASSAAELDDLITAYRKEWRTPHVWLIGFSFGANVLPSLVNQLKPEHRASITQLSLLEPTQDVFFEVELEDYMTVGWLNRISQTLRHMRQPVSHHDPLPALRQLQGQMPITCFYSTGETPGACIQPSLPAWITKVESHGGHYFNGDFDTLVRQLIEQHSAVHDGPSARRATTAPAPRSPSPAPPPTPRHTPGR